MTWETISTWTILISARSITAAREAKSKRPKSRREAWHWKIKMAAAPCSMFLILIGSKQKQRLLCCLVSEMSPYRRSSFAARWAHCEPTDRAKGRGGQLRGRGGPFLTNPTLVRGYVSNPGLPIPALLSRYVAPANMRAPYGRANTDRANTNISRTRVGSSPEARWVMARAICSPRYFAPASTDSPPGHSPASRQDCKNAP